jgi:hypothetical protein
MQQKIVQQIEDIKILRQKIREMETKIAAREQDLSDMFLGNTKPQLRKPWSINNGRQRSPKTCRT